MAALISSDFEIPAEISQGIFEKAQKGSTLAQLSGARPQKFGKQQVWVLTSPPKAELVGEAGQKSPTPTAYASKTVNPFKLQVTMRFSQEVQWTDEDVQIGVLQDLASNASIALGRALDLVGIHKINPLTGTVSSLVKEGLVDTKQSVQLAGTKYDEAIEAAAGMIISSGYVPSGIAMDPTLSFGLSTMRDADGRKIYPEIGFGQNLTNFSGMTAAVSDTVSAKNEITPDTKLLGIVGQFDAFRWGVQRSIGAHLIEYGDPDGLGDLQRQNQIAIRAEIVYGIGIMDQAAFTKIVKADLYKQTGIVVESDDVLDSTMFKPIIEEKTEDLIEDSETETGVAEAENTEEPVDELEEPTEDSEIPDIEEPVEAKKEASAKNTRKRTQTAKK